jgi:hypothetical protein
MRKKQRPDSERGRDLDSEFDDDDAAAAAALIKRRGF